MNLKAKSFIYILSIMQVLSFVATAQEKEAVKRPVNPQPYSLVLKTNPLPVLWGPIWFTSEYRFVNEFVVAPNQSSEIGISLLGKSPIFSLIDNAFNQNRQLKIIVRGFRFQLSHRFYFSKAINLSDDYAPEGLYIGPLFSYSTARFTDKYRNLYNIYIRSTHVNLNLIGGYQLIIPGDFVVDVFAGMGYKENSWIEHTPPTITPIDIGGPFYNSNLKLILGFNVGKAF